MSDNDKILAKDLIKISGVSELLTGDRFALRLDRSFGKHEGSVNRLFDIVQEWIDSDKSFASELSTPLKEFVADLPTEFVPTSLVLKEKKEITKAPKPFGSISVPKSGYEIAERIPFGTHPVEIIGHKLHKDNDDEIYYYKLTEGKESKVIVLHSEKEVKEFIRKEIIK